MPAQHQWTEDIPWVLPCGIVAIDSLGATDGHGHYGLPAGSVVTISGDPKHGKTSFVLHYLAEAQKEQNGHPEMHCVYLDSEGCMMQIERLHAYGIDTDNITKVNPSNLEEAFEVIRRHMLASLEMDEKDRISFLFVLDSHSNLQVASEENLDSIVDGGSIASYARVTRLAMRRLNPLIRKTQSILIAVAQATIDISSAAYMRYPRKSHIAKRSLDFASAICFRIKQTGKIEENIDGLKRKTGMECNIQCDMSKVGWPGGVAKDMVMQFATGFDRWICLHNGLASVSLIIRKGGRYQTLDGEISYSGKHGIEALEPEVQKELEDRYVREYTKK